MKTFLKWFPVLILLLSLELQAFLIPVVDVGSWLAESVTFAEELEKFVNFVKLYQKFKHILDQRVDKLKRGFKGLSEKGVREMGKVSEELFKRLEESEYYKHYQNRTIFQRVENGQKLLDVVKDIVDLEKEFKNTTLYLDPVYREYLDEQYEAYKEHITRLEHRMKYLNYMKEADKRRLKAFEKRYRLFIDSGVGMDSKLGGKVGSEAQAISLLSESMLETVLQDQEIAVLMRLKFEETLSRFLNGVLLQNRMLLIGQKKRKK